MELKIYQPQEGQLTEIKFNFEELRTELAEQLKKYQGLVYSDENIKEAKADKAKLNNFKKAIEARRIEIKKQVLAPYDVFETQVKELVAMIDQPVNEIDAQVKKYEQSVKDEKLAKIKTYYDNQIGNLESLVPFDTLFDPKWLNVTVKMPEIENTIAGKLVMIQEDLKVIEDLNSPYENQLKRVYLKSGYNLQAALQEKKRIEEDEARLAQHKKAQEEAKVTRAHELEPTAPTKPESAPPREEAAPAKERTTYTLDFRVKGTREEILAVKNFMDDNNIRYGKVPVGEDERKVS